MNPFGDPRKLMKQLQQQQEKMQAEIAALVVEATSGGGMVKVVANGRQQVMTIAIEKEVVDPNDVEMLQDLAPELADCEPGALRAAKLPRLEIVIRMGEETTPGMLNFGEVCHLGGDEDIVTNVLQCFSDNRLAVTIADTNGGIEIADSAVKGVAY